VPDTSLRSAVVLAVGSELTTGSTRDTNSGQLAAELSALGVEVLWTQALPDRLELVAQAIRDGLQQAGLVVSTGGLGPTPDDLTREAIAAATDRQPTVDPELERWLRALFRRRGIEMPSTNLKQAWLVPGAVALRNGNGTAPGWWLELGDRVVVALPGPPREMWPMWQAEVRPRLVERGVGTDLAHQTLRLTGIGESALAELLGHELERGRDPEVATYARADAVDVRISSRGVDAEARVTAMVEQILPRLERYAFARGDDGWPEALGQLLSGRSLATAEIGNGGQLIALLGEAPFVVRGEVRPAGPPASELAEAVRDAADADVALALRAREGEVDIDVEIAIASNEGVYSAERKAFLTGPEGHRRAALAACAELWRWLRGEVSAS
jgi:nicotinamide-nucleotide amidase